MGLYKNQRVDMYSAERLVDPEFNSLWVHSQIYKLMIHWVEEAKKKQRGHDWYRPILEILYLQYL